MDYSFGDIIQQVESVNSSSLSNEIKLRRSGELFYRGSLGILARAEAALDNVRKQDVDLTDTPVDNSFSQFLASLTQQSISTIFLQKYLKPQYRVKYERDAPVKVRSLTSTEAIDLFDLALVESEVASLAHDEDISAWVELVTKCINSNPQIDTLLEIANATGLSLAQVFISLLFADFELSQSGDFYDGFEIKIKSILANY